MSAGPTCQEGGSTVGASLIFFSNFNFHTASDTYLDVNVVTESGCV